MRGSPRGGDLVRSPPRVVLLYLRAALLAAIGHMMAPSKGLSHDDPVVASTWLVQGQVSDIRIFVGPVGVECAFLDQCVPISREHPIRSPERVSWDTLVYPSWSRSARRPPGCGPTV
ncbi:hypothetical protein Raf01_49430 [Rugosimonospora africana]|uniref:Uncharacterized protein n=1 Tax=Rugosimonospora africana TaxID=556532 RepID=A0A8J3QUK7_9ACTN|nr:hypothetical protein Raf01_49430 [Rugosimonospora africana]